MALDQLGNRVDLLQISFLDIRTERDFWFESCSYDCIFNRKKASQILDFVHGNWNRVGAFLFQCESGDCCAPAVAAAISYIHWRGEERNYFTWFHPNPLVYQTLLKTYYDPDGWLSR